MKKVDREKMLDYLNEMSNGYIYCFNRDFTNAYLMRFINNRWDSALYNNEIGRLKLEVLLSQGVEDTSEIDSNDSKLEEVKTFFIKELKRSFKEKLPKHFEELDNQKKAEKKAEKESKGKK